MKIFVTGIDTGIGKTVVSAVLTKVFGASYWKPIQAGTEEITDSQWIKQILPETDIVPERYCLKTPVSPHWAAKIDGLKIHLQDFTLPRKKNLIIEGAGGLLVPVNDNETLLDLIKMWKIPVLLVSKNYLGSINHTLLTIKTLQHHQIDITGVLFNGESHQESERIICKMGNVKHLGNISSATGKITRNFIEQEAEKLKNMLL